jgi:citrate lyase alpha subunit
MKRTRKKSVAGIEVAVPPSLLKDRFAAGFAHAMRGGQLNKIEYFKLSFREGFRAAKLQMRAMRRNQGIIDFPLQGRVKMKTL